MFIYLQGWRNDLSRRLPRLRTPDLHRMALVWKRDQHGPLEDARPFQVSPGLVL